MQVRVIIFLSKCRLWYKNLTYFLSRSSCELVVKKEHAFIDNQILSRFSIQQKNVIFSFFFTTKSTTRERDFGTRNSERNGKYSFDI
jgi:hypothetical protein